MAAQLAFLNSKLRYEAESKAANEISRITYKIREKERKKRNREVAKERDLVSDPYTDVELLANTKIDIYQINFKKEMRKKVKETLLQDSLQKEIDDKAEFDALYKPRAELEEARLYDEWKKQRELSNLAATSTHTLTAEQASLATRYIQVSDSSSSQSGNWHRCHYFS